MLIYLDESGDLGWSLNKPNGQGGSSRYITIAGLIVDERQMRNLLRFVQELLKKYNNEIYIEKKGSRFTNDQATSIIRDLQDVLTVLPSLTIMSITSNKQNVIEPLRRDKNVFYNHMLSTLLIDTIKEFDKIQVVLDNRSIRAGSQNGFEDCLKAKCWGELGLNTTISCRYENSSKNPGIWIADWLSNFVWRHYENLTHEPYFACQSLGARYREKTLFM